MVYVRRTKDKDDSKKRKRHPEKLSDNTIISYKKSKKRKIRRNQDEKHPTYVFN